MARQQNNSASFPLIKKIHGSSKRLLYDPSSPPSLVNQSTPRNGREKLLRPRKESLIVTKTQQSDPQDPKLCKGLFGLGGDEAFGSSWREIVVCPGHIWTFCTGNLVSRSPAPFSKQDSNDCLVDYSKHYN